MKQIAQLTLRTFTRIFRTPDIKFAFLCVMVVIVISTSLLAIDMIGGTYEYNVSDIALEDIRVPKDIYYVNEDETRMRQMVAGESAPLVFDRDASIMNENLAMINMLFNHVDSTIKSFPPIGTDDVPFYIMVIKSKLPQYQQYNEAILTEIFSSPKPSDIKRAVIQALMHFYDEKGKGIIEKPYDNPLNIKNTGVIIRSINSNATDTDIETISTLENLKTIDEARKMIPRVAFQFAHTMPQKTVNSIAGIVQWHLKPNTRFNQEETKRRIDEKVKNQKPVMAVLKKGLTLVREGDTITPEVKFRIDIFNKHTRSTHYGYIFGVFIIQLVFLFVLGFFLLDYSSTLIPDRKAIMIIFTLIVFYQFYTFFIARSETLMNSDLTFALVLPIPFVTMIVSILYNTYLALLLGIYSVFFATMIDGGSLSTMIITFGAAILGVFINANVTRRTDFLRGGFVMGLVNTIVIFAVALIQEIPIVRALNNVVYAFANGIINSILVLGILPLYENVFGITTKFKLLELSDLNADIFKQMLLEAPGTYNHSLIVSTMAETACKDINADYMLARVGAFYHDIGKIPDAAMYIENKVTDPRAKTMKPKEYTKLITSHVDKGVEIARQNMLPENVIDFIREHHGETTMTYFYHQALAELDTSTQAETIDKRDFQYKGPKPHSKETAVVMLADAIEAASRSLQEPTREKLQGMVRRIIYNKLNDGELEMSDLSMTELRTIQNSFLKILYGIFHTRIEYPDQKDVKKLEKKVMPNGAD
ncbi:MAG: HDIG domain-containing protein [Spirochaetes bacterium]|nr:HDIG domain-containing protein [Spirochaetota bacterium]